MQQMRQRLAFPPSTGQVSVAQQQPFRGAKTQSPIKAWSIQRRCQLALQQCELQSVRLCMLFIQCFQS